MLCAILHDRAIQIHQIWLEIGRGSDRTRPLVQGLVSISVVRLSLCPSSRFKSIKDVAEGEDDFNATAMLTLHPTKSPCPPIYSTVIQLNPPRAQSHNPKPPQTKEPKTQCPNES